MLKCSDSSLYTGYTTNIDKRIDVHNKGKGAKYTRGKGPVKLVYQENYFSKSVALKREHGIKKLTKKQKESLIMKASGGKK
ncbi:MAG: GIY-YIG nuclease family protein [Culicoidibacterales bacterium]